MTQARVPHGVPGRSRLANRRGQMVFEFVMLLPLLLGVLFGAAKVGSVVATAAIVHYAAFMQARSTSVHTNPPDAGRRIVERAFRGSAIVSGNRVGYRMNLFLPLLDRAPRNGVISAEYGLKPEPTAEGGDNA